MVSETCHSRVEKSQAKSLLISSFAISSRSGFMCEKIEKTHGQGVILTDEIFYIPTQITMITRLYDTMSNVSILLLIFRFIASWRIVTCKCVIVTLK